MPLTGWPVATVLRGKVVFKDGKVQGGPSGRFVKRPARDS
jgi:dihydroorotase-like cyclic amidohydrolase